jgi:peptidoglycan/xylan/chitin deacetylase (PgdA/CDA1 family)
MTILTADYQREVFASGAFVRVVNWHNTPESERGKLRAELAWYAKRYDPVLPEDLDRFFETGHWGKSKPGILPVFYDGYLNNATVAAPVCDELGISAWFFPPTAFLSVDPTEQRAYADAHHITLVPQEREQPRLAMSWDDLEVISRRHVVAAHTANHTQARHIVTTADVEREVLEPVRLIEAVTGTRPPAFAWLYGTPFDPSSLAWRAVLDAGIRYAVSNTVYQRIGD